MRRARNVGSLVVACAVLGWGATSATAAAPSRTAWFSALTAGGVVAPSTTAADDLHVSGTGTQVTAYAAVFLPVASDGGTLTLAVRATLPVAVPSLPALPVTLPVATPSTVELAACPTTTQTWTAGGNQPNTAGPAYDCTFADDGVLSPDGTTVSFTLTSTDLGPTGSASMALVPLPEGTSATTVDLGDAAYVDPTADAVDPATTDPGATDAASLTRRGPRCD